MGVCRAAERPVMQSGILWDITGGLCKDTVDYAMH